MRAQTASSHVGKLRSLLIAVTRRTKYLDNFIRLKNFPHTAISIKSFLLTTYYTGSSSINFINISLVKTKGLSLKLEIKIEIPQDIIFQTRNGYSVQQGILKAISKGPYEEGLSFKIVSAYFS